MVYIENTVLFFSQVEHCRRPDCRDKGTSTVKLMDYSLLCYFGNFKFIELQFVCWNTMVKLYKETLVTF